MLEEAPLKRVRAGTDVKRSRTGEAHHVIDGSADTGGQAGTIVRKLLSALYLQADFYVRADIRHVKILRMRL